MVVLVSMLSVGVSAECWRELSCCGRSENRRPFKDNSLLLPMPLYSGTYAVQLIKSCYIAVCQRSTMPRYALALAVVLCHN